MACSTVKMPAIPIKTSDYPTPARCPAISLLDSRGTIDLLGKRRAHWRANLRKMLNEVRAFG